MRLRSPDHVVIGANRPQQMADFLGRFGFTARSSDVLPAVAAEALYGFGHPLQEIELQAPGSSVGRLRIVETPSPPIERLPFALGPALLDLYTRDIEASMAIAGAAGAHQGPIVEYPVEGLGSVFEGRAIGPEGLALGFVMSDDRRSSLLDHDPSALHSEAHAYVWTVASIDASVGFWVDAGMYLQLDSTVNDPGISAFMELPQPNVAIRIVHLTGAQAEPIRFELMEFRGHDGPTVESFPLRPGLGVAAFTVSDLASAVAALSRVHWRIPIPVDDTMHAAHAVAGLAPGGVRLELWEDRQHVS